MEEKESVLYIVLLAVTMIIMPGTLGKTSPLYEFSRLVILGAIIFLAIAMILIAVKNIPSRHFDNCYQSSELYRWLSNSNL